MQNEIEVALNDFRKEINSRKTLANTLQKIHTSLDNGDYWRVESLINKPQKENFQEYIGGDLLEDTLKETDTLIQQHSRRFSSLLKEDCIEEEIPLEGVHPVYRAFGLLEVRVLNERKIRIGTQSWNTLYLPKVLQVIKREYKAIVNRELNPSVFYKRLEKAYQESLQKERKPFGHPCHILDVYFNYLLGLQTKNFISNAVSENFRSYPQTYFAYDLKEYINSPLEKEGIVKLSPVRGSKNTITIPDERGGSQKGLLAIERVKTSGSKPD